MELTLESGPAREVRTRAELERALADVGGEGNGFAVLGKAPEVYLQTAAIGPARFVVEYRDGSEASHFRSKRTDLSHDEVVALFGYYLDGSSEWRDSLEWTPAFAASGKSGASGRGRTIVAVAFGLMGLALVVLGLRFASATRAFIDRSARASGTVVELARSREGGSYFPVVRFETPDGRTVTFRNRTGGDPPSHRVGETVPVLYDRAQPERAAIDTPSSLWLGPVLVGGLGVIFCAVAAGALLLAARNRRAAAPRAPGSPAPRSDRGLVRR